MDEINAYNALFYKIAVEKFPLKSIDEIKCFYKDLKGAPDCDFIKMKSESLISLIYSINGLYCKSLEIDLKYLAELSVENPAYGLFVISAIKTSARLKRTEEVIHYVKRFLTSTTQDFHLLIPLLSWYAEFSPDKEMDSFADLESNLSVAVSSIGTEINTSLSFADKADFLKKEFKRGSRDYYDLQISYQHRPDNQLITDYLANEPLRFYRDQANKLYNR